MSGCVDITPEARALLDAICDVHPAAIRPPAIAAVAGIRWDGAEGSMEVLRDLETLLARKLISRQAEGFVATPAALGRPA